MEVEIAGEGELREIEDSFKQPPDNLLDIPEPQVTEEIEQDKPEAEEIPPPETPRDEPSNLEELTPSEPVPEDQPPEALEDQQIEGAVPKETPSMEEVSNEEIDKTQQEENGKEAEEQAVQEEKNKAIAAAEALSALKKIDKIDKMKKKAKKKRKKLREFAKKAAEDKIDKEFNKVLAKNMTSSGGLGKKGLGRGAYGSGADLSDSDKANIMAQIVPYWAVTSGVKDAESMMIEINMEMRSNGEVIPSSIKILDESRYKNDGIFRAAADSAKRAILQASPLSIPRNKIALLQEVTLRFNMKEALGR
jgi:hypothetical protein